MYTIEAKEEPYMPEIKNQLPQLIKEVKQSLNEVETIFAEAERQAFLAARGLTPAIRAQRLSNLKNKITQLEQKGVAGSTAVLQQTQTKLERYNKQLLEILVTMKPMSLDEIEFKLNSKPPSPELPAPLSPREMQKMAMFRRHSLGVIGATGDESYKSDQKQRSHKTASPSPELNTRKDLHKVRRKKR